MVWSYNRSFSQNSPEARWTALFEYLDGKGDATTNQGGWKWGTAGMTNGDGLLLFTYVDTGGTTRYYQAEFDFSDDSRGMAGNLQVNPDYDPSLPTSNEDSFPYLHVYAGASETWYDPSTLNYDWKLWTSNQDPTAFFLTENDIMIGMWPSCKDGTRQTPVLSNSNSVLTAYGTSGFVNYGCMMPNMAKGYNFGQCYGFPAGNQTSSSNSTISLYGWYNGNFLSYKQAMYKNIPMRAAGAYWGTYANDIRQSIMPNASYLSLTSLISTTVGMKVAYGDDQYWLCLSGDAGNNSIILSTGDSNPTSDLEN